MDPYEIMAHHLVTDQVRFDINRFCFKEQIAFIEDQAKFKTAVCSRRAGKTVACAADMIRTCLSKEKQVCLYITLSRNNAKKIIWGELLEINRNYKLDGQPNETELSLKFPNNSVIYLSGAKDKSEIEKFRGLAISLCYIDECQSFRDYIRNLIDEVISKALFDYNGTLCLMGTPGPVPSGYFYDCAHSLEWTHHGWSMFENPWLLRKSGKTPQELLQRELTRKGVTENDPTIQRECFGQWCTDQNALVFKYNPSKNHFGVLPIYEKKWEYVIGVDLGFDDSDAIAVLGWNDSSKSVYLVEEQIQNKQGISELASKLIKLYERYNPLRITMDTGGLGKKIAEEVQKRFQVPIQAAEKVRKFEYIELLNDAMRTSKFMAKHTSRFAQDCMLVEWEMDEEGTRNEKLKISDRYHSDICDAVLYAFRESLHWLYEPEPKKLHPLSPEWMQAHVKEIEENLIAEVEGKKQDIDIWADMREPEAWD